MFFQKLKRPKLPKLEGNKPYIMPTLYGIAFLFMIVDVFALGYYRNSGPFHTVGLTLIVFGLVAMIQTNSNLQNVSVSVDQVDLGMPGGHASLRVSLRATGDVTVYNLEVQSEKRFALSDSLHIEELSASAPFSLTIQCPTRGVYPLGRIKIFSRGVYGLFYTWRWQEVSSELIVYPSPKGNMPLPGGEEGAAQRSLHSEDFIGHRPFVAGDSLKQIDWKAYARGSDLLLKDFADQSTEGLDFRWEDTRGDTETRLEQLAAWVIQMSLAQRPYSLSMPAESIERGLGDHHDHRALRALAIYKEA